MGARFLAVVAHHDIGSILDDAFKVIVECLEAVCDRVLIVSATDCPPRYSRYSDKSELLLRPNVGYDFYSYRVGITKLMAEEVEYDGIYVVNSSFLVSSRSKFVSTLQKMKTELSYAGAVGLVRSLQWEDHLQSYLLLLRRDTVSAGWFSEWLRSVEPRNSKLEVILCGELGLSRALRENGVRAISLYQPSLEVSASAIWNWSTFLIKTKSLVALLKNPWRTLRGFNPSQFCALSISRELGVVKTEVLRDNPHSIPLDPITGTFECRERQLAEGYLNRYWQRTRSGKGVTVTVQRRDAIPRCRVVQSDVAGRPGVRVAVVAHVFYPDLIEEIREHVRNILVPFDLIATTPHEALVPSLLRKFSGLAVTVVVAVCENRGRDIGPFISIHRHGLLKPYDVVLKIHGKKSTYSDRGDEWRKGLYRSLFGDPAVVRDTLSIFETQSHVGIVGPFENFLTHEHFWGANKERVQQLLHQAGILKIGQEPPLEFFAGSMFWFRPTILDPLLKLSEDVLDFEPEAGQQDGTLAHALERTFCVLANYQGMVVSTLELNGVDIRNALDQAHKHGVPVLVRPQNQSPQ